MSNITLYTVVKEGYFSCKLHCDYIQFYISQPTSDQMVKEMAQKIAGFLYYAFCCGINNTHQTEKNQKATKGGDNSIS